MKSLITLVMLFLSPILLAQQTRVVKTIGEGSCWIASEGQGQVSLVSFNDQRSKVLDGREVQEHVESLLQERGANIQGLNTFAHCSSHGLSLVFSMSTDRGDICLWSYLGEHGELQRSAFGHMDQQLVGKFCDGAKYGELMVLTKGEDAGTMLQAELESVLGNAGQFAVKALGSGTFKVTLSQELHGQEAKIKDSLLNSEALVSVIRTVEYSSFYHPIGEVMELSEFSYHE